jgi:hypothetical protein
MASAVSADFSRRMRMGVALGFPRSKARYACEMIAFMGEEIFYRFALREERRDVG